MTEEESGVFSELGQYTLDASVAELLPLDYCVENSLVLLGSVPRFTDEAVQVGMLHPEDTDLKDDLARRLGRKLTPVQLNEFEIRQAISRIYDVRLDEHETGFISIDAGRKIAFEPGQSPARMLEDLLSDAVRRRATDVHIEVYTRDVDLRFRVDSVLQQVTTPLSPDNITRVVSRIKVLCSLDLLERRRAQDGRFSALYREDGVTRRIDFRVSVVPGPDGEDVVLRILDPERYILSLKNLGMEADMLGRFRRILNYPDGLILVTGPTGSGKTTTLYASVNTLKERGLKILTVEDPVEYTFEKVNQKNISGTMGFADYLRAFLRQNPDVIMVGEIRDATTAEVAVRAATTGHLILSTLHTGDAIGVIGRLRTLDVPNDYTASVLVGVLAQRLVRRICQACKEPAPRPDEFIPLFYDGQPPDTFHHGRGCEACEGTGYRGLVGVFELFTPSEEVAATIAHGLPVQTLRKVARQHGDRPLVDDALAKVASGLTTLQEVARRLPPRFPGR